MSSFEEELKKYLGSDRGKDLDFEDLLDNVRLIYQKDRQRLREAINKHCYQAYNGDMVIDCDKFMKELGLEDE